MPGAAMMSTLAALRTGAGVTTLAAPAQTARMLAPHLMEAISLPLPEGEKGEVSSAVLPGLRRLLPAGTGRGRVELYQPGRFPRGAAPEMLGNAGDHASSR